MNLANTTGLAERFSSVDLMPSSNNADFSGVNAGLVTQWLVALSKGFTGEEDRFFEDLDYNKSWQQSQALFGIGYAKEAIENQSKYQIGDDDIASTNYAKAILQSHDLTLESSSSVTLFNEHAVSDIARTILNQDSRYSKLLLRSYQGVHVIGFHRRYSIYGKSEEVSLFDPLQGCWHVHSAQALLELVRRVMRRYIGWTNAHYVVEAFG